MSENRNIPDLSVEQVVSCSSTGRSSVSVSVSSVLSPEALSERVSQRMAMILDVSCSRHASRHVRARIADLLQPLSFGRSDALLHSALERHIAQGDIRGAALGSFLRAVNAVLAKAPALLSLRLRPHEAPPADVDEVAELYEVLTALLHKELATYFRQVSPKAFRSYSEIKSKESSIFSELPNEISREWFSLKSIKSSVSLGTFRDDFSNEVNRFEDLIPEALGRKGFRRELELALYAEFCRWVDFQAGKVARSCGPDALRRFEDYYEFRAQRPLPPHAPTRDDAP